MSMVLVSSYICKMRRLACVHGTKNRDRESGPILAKSHDRRVLHAVRTLRPTEAVVKSDAADQVWPYRKGTG